MKDKNMLYNKNIKIDNVNDSSAVIFEMIKENTKVFDMGCACGDLAEQLSKLKKCEVFGLEYNADSVAVCKQKNVFRQIEQFDLNTLTEKNFSAYKQKFDYCVLGDVLEHLQHPDNVLKIAKSYVKTDGSIILSLPNLAHASIKTNLLLDDFTRTPLGILDKTHLHFFTYKNIAELLSTCGLIIERISYTCLPVNGYQPHKIEELPPEIADFILKDPHSHIFQYILLCKPANYVSYKNTLNRLKQLSVPAAKSSLLFNIKRFIMTKCPYIIKYLEKIRK